jgi:hypothetical protein
MTTTQMTPGQRVRKKIFVDPLTQEIIEGVIWSIEKHGPKTCEIYWDGLDWPTVYFDSSLDSIKALVAPRVDGFGNRIPDGIDL